MYEDVGMAMPKTIETRCSYGSMQARQGYIYIYTQGHKVIVWRIYTPEFPRARAHKPQHPEWVGYNYFKASCLVTGASCYGNCDV